MSVLRTPPPLVILKRAVESNSWLEKESHEKADRSLKQKHEEAHDKEVRKNGKQNGAHGGKRGPLLVDFRSPVAKVICADHLPWGVKHKRQTEDIVVFPPPRNIVK